MAVWVVVGAVEDVPEFLKGVEVNSVIDDVRVDHPVCVSLEERGDVHHFVLVVAELLGVAYQLRLQLGFEGSVCLSVASELLWGGDVLGSADAGGARAGRVEREIQASRKPSDLCLLLDEIGFLVLQLGFQPGDLGSDHGYCIGCGSARFEDFEEFWEQRTAARSRI